MLGWPLAMSKWLPWWQPVSMYMIEWSGLWVFFNSYVLFILYQVPQKHLSLGVTNYGLRSYRKSEIQIPATSLFGHTTICSKGSCIFWPGSTERECGWLRQVWICHWLRVEPSGWGRKVDEKNGTIHGLSRGWLFYHIPIQYVALLSFCADPYLDWFHKLKV